MLGLDGSSNWRMTLASRNSTEQIEDFAGEGWSALERGDWMGAEQAYTSAMKLARELGDPVQEALFRSYRGEARRGQERYQEAREDVEHALAVAMSEGCPQLVAHTQYMLAAMDTDVYDYSKAEDRLMAALDAALECKDEAATEVALAMLGHICTQTGRLETAYQCFERALEARPDSPNQATWLGNIANTLADMGVFDKAIDTYHQAMEYARSQGDLSTEAKCHASEGFTHLQQEDFGKALECYQRALQVSNEDANPHFKSSWLGALGNVYLRLGQTDKAWEAAEEGLRLAKELKDRHEEAAHLDTLGDCLLERGETEKALSHYSSAWEIGKSISDMLGERIYLSNMARAHKRMGNSDKALELFRKAIELFEVQRGQLKSDAYKTTFAGTGQNLYRDTIQACLESGHRIEALEYVGRAKSRAILDLLKNSPIDISELEHRGDDSISKLVLRERELSQQIASLERIYWQGPMDMDPGHRGVTVAPEDAPKLYDEWLDVVEKLKRRHPNYANMVAVDVLNFSDVLQLWGENSGKTALPQQTAVVEFFLSDQFLMTAAVWSGATQPEINIIFDTKELAGLLNDVSDLLEMSSTEGWEVPVSLCKRIYQRIFGQIGEKLPADVTRLIVVPHGVLHRVPFAALHDGSTYLIERYSLSYLPSLSLIPILAGAILEEGQKPDPLRYLVSAISDYSATRSDGIVFSSRLRSAAGLEDLSYTLEEGKTVQRLASQHVDEARLLTNDEVKEGLLNHFSDYQVVHFAGHAVFVPEQPMLSGLVLADGSILTAARILHSNALRTKCGKLLVLSACQTGVNVITNGGEILGLARALMYAGMPNLILSLWEVADRSTAELMQNFHNAWQGGKTGIADALAAAQRAAVKEGQPIHAWAPFIHLGID